MRKYVKKISSILLIALFVTMLAPASYAEAAEELYLAYKTTEYGAEVHKLTAVEAEDYRVEKLLMSPGDKVALCFINASNWKNPKWTSSDTKVATVDGDGKITAKNPGVSEITFTYEKKLTNKKVTAKTKVYVGEKAWGVGFGTSKVTMGITQYQMKAGTDIELNVYGIPEIDSWNYQVQWSSSNRKVAEMLGGELYARKAGTAEIGVKIKNRATGKVIERKAKVTVTDPANVTLDTWDNPYYKMYGENYKRMFSTSTLSSAALEIEFDMLDEATYVLLEETKTIGISGILELTDVLNALTIAFDGIFKGKNSMSEKGRLEAIQYLIQEITDDGVDEKYVNNVSDALKKTKSIFDSMNDVQDVNEAIKKIEGMDSTLSKSEMNALLKYLKNDAVGDIKKVLAEGITISEYLISTVCLYEADSKLLDDLQKCAEPEDELYKDIELLKKERAKDPVKFFKQKYVSDVISRTLSKALVKLAGKEATALFDAVDTVVSMTADMAGVSSLSEVTKATYLMGYITDLSNRITKHRTDVMNDYETYTNEELKEKIEEYELLYNTYLSMIDPVCSAVYKLETGWNQELLDDKAIPARGYDYSRHVAEAMNLYLNANPTVDETKAAKKIENDVQVKMDELLNKLGVKDGKTTYFTVNQRACRTTRYSGHGCSNCNVGSIIKTSWFRNAFGTINTSLFPSHDVNASRRDHAGQSCFGFACFAQWYVFADSTADKVTAERVATVKYNKADLQANVKPGDVLRVNGHSLLVYAVEDKGLRVIDSNWNMGNQLNCVVQKHLITYDIAWCAGKTTYVNRVTEVEGPNIGNVNSNPTVTQKTEITSSQTVTSKPAVTPIPDVTQSPTKIYGYLNLHAMGGWRGYNIGTDADFGADKAYTIYHGSKLEILGEETNSKGNKVYHVYSEDLKMECYVVKKAVTLGEVPKMIRGTLQCNSWYNVGTDVEMGADKAYRIYNGAKLEIWGTYTNSTGNKIYHVYSPDLKMNCYVAARFVKVSE